MNKVFYNPRGQVIGTLAGTTFSKKVNSKKHFMRIFNGYGFEKKVVDELKTLGCKEVTVTDETNTTYRLPFSVLLERGFEKNLDTPQIFVPLLYFSTGKPQASLFGSSEN